MTEEVFVAFDQASPAPGSGIASRPDPSSWFDNDSDFVETFASKVAAASVHLLAPAPLATGVIAPPLPPVLPPTTDSVTESVTSKSTRCSITDTFFSRLSQMEATLAKVNWLDTLMNRIANQLGLLQEPKSDTP
jgi:hypothetical protein